MADDVLVDTLSEPLNGTTRAKVDIDSGPGNLDVVLPDGGASLRVSARSGAGNVSVNTK